MKLNKTYLKKLEKISNDQLIMKLQAFKMQNRVCDSPVTHSKRFQINYNTALYEAGRRKLLLERTADKIEKCLK